MPGHLNLGKEHSEVILSKYDRHLTLWLQRLHFCILDINCILKLWEMHTENKRNEIHSKRLLLKKKCNDFPII